MARFLSDEWIEAFDQAAASTDELVLGDEGEDLVIQHVVTDPAGAPVQTFHVHLSAGPARVRRGPAEDPTVTFTQDLDTATAIASGTETAQAAFMAGRLRVGGRVDQLIARHGELAGVDDLFASLRSETEH